jgi:hypothetical protein
MNSQPNQMKNKIEAQVKNDSYMELLTYMVAFACEEHAEDFLVRWGAIQEGEETTLSHGETVNLLLDHLATLNSKTRTAVIFDMLSFAFQGRDLFSNLESHDVATAAELYHVNAENADKQVRSKIEAGEGAPAAQAAPSGATPRPEG